MVQINEQLTLPDNEIEITAIRAQGSGGQNVNKVSSAIHLRFDIAGSAVLSDKIKARLRGLNDRRISDAGVVIIKSQRFRSQERNREDAITRLADLVRKGLEEPQVRKKTRPSKKAKEKRLNDKARRARLKGLRGSVGD